MRLGYLCVPHPLAIDVATLEDFVAAGCTALVVTNHPLDQDPLLAPPRAATSGPARGGHLRPGDALVVAHLDAVSDSVDSLIATLGRLESAGVGLFVRDTAGRGVWAVSPARAPDRTGVLAEAGQAELVCGQGACGLNHQSLR